MHTGPVITLIVPVYNTGMFLRECLDSIAGQVYSNMEIILVDDGSTDNSLEICKEYSARDKRFRIITFPANQGQSAARNAAMTEATGKYITFIDSDDVISSEMVGTLYDMITSTSADMASVRFLRFTGRPRTGGSAQSGVVHELSARNALIKMLYQTGFNASVCGKLFTRKSLHGMTFTPGQLYEDLDFMDRYLSKIERVASSQAILYHYRRNPNSTLGVFRPKRLDVLDVTTAIIDRSQNDPQLLSAAQDRHLSASFNMYALLCRNRMANSPTADRCWNSIRTFRSRSLVNPHVRAKNKIGIIASLTGRRMLTIITRLITI